MTTFYITGKCNIECFYCYAWKKLGHDMPLDVMEQACLWFNQNRRDDLKLWGGEPLQYKQGVKFILGHARPNAFNITSNGICLDEELYEWLMMHGVSAALSWDGSEESQNSGRDGTYDKLMEVLPMWKNLIAANGGQVLKTVSRPELLYEDVKAIYKAGFERCFLNFYRPYGAMYSLDEIKILEKEYHRVIKDFHMKPDFTLTDVMQYQNIWREQQSNLYVPHCGINAMGIAIGADGMIYPCDDAVLLGEEYVIGSVWDGVDQAKEKVLRNKLNQLPSRCSNCDLKCYPCPVCSVLNTGELAGDPGDCFCELRKMQHRVVNQYIPQSPFRSVR